MCSTGSGTDSTACLAIADSDDFTACPAVTAAGACLAGGTTLAIFTTPVTYSFA